VVKTRNICIQPIVRRVTVLAGCGELRFHVTRIIGRRVVLLVTGIARRRHELKFAGSSPFVTGIAIDSGVGTRQWEAIVVLLHVLDRNLPSTNRMALLTVGS